MRPVRTRGAVFALATAMLVLSASSIASSTSADGVDYTDFNLNNFTRSATVDNQWLPLVPGTQFVLDGVAVDGNKLVPHRVVSTVTDLVKVAGGVRTRVIYDLDFSSGVLTEAELAFWAQDNGGNVWLLGEYPEEYQNKHLRGAPSTWINGEGDAHAGVLMRAHPRTGTSSYTQGYVPSIGFDDIGQVFATGQQVCEPVACYSNVLVVEEWNGFALTEGHQLKYHAPGVGIVRVASKDSADQEALDLTSIGMLSRSALDAVDAQVKAQDQRGYQVAAALYQHTSPVQPG